MEYFKNVGLITEFSGMHNLKDLTIIQNTIAKLQYNGRYLTEEDLTICNF